MRIKKLIVGITLTLSASMSFNFVNAQELTGDTKLACEAVLCLSTSMRPDECAPSVMKFFSIWDKKPWKIPAKRFDFLKLCPISKSTPNSVHSATPAEITAYMNIIAQGATLCSANYINRTNYRIIRKKVCNGRPNREGMESCTYVERKQIFKTLPLICEKYTNHYLTDGSVLKTLKYVPEPNWYGHYMGHWIDDLLSIDKSSEADDDNSGNK